MGRVDLLAAADAGWYFWALYWRRNASGALLLPGHGKLLRPRGSNTITTRATHVQEPKVMHGPSNARFAVLGNTIFDSVGDLYCLGSGSF